MENRRNITIILAVVLIFGILIQVSRTDYLFKLSSKDNQFGDPQKSVKETSSNVGFDDTGLLNDNFLVIFDKGDWESEELASNICKTLEYMKKQYVLCETATDSEKYENYSNLLIAFHDLNRINDMNKLDKYVYNGGKVFFTIYPDINDSLYKIYNKLGIYELGDYVASKGIKLNDNVLIKGSGLSINSGFIDNFGITVGLNSDCTIHAVTSKNVPLMWDTKYGKGKFMIYNGTKLSEKNFRGIIVGGISLLNEDFIYPVINTKLLYIDDFPAPFPEGYDSKIKKEYNKDIKGFFRNIWWQDMLNSALENNIKYTGMITQTYNDSVKPPFKDSSSENKKLLIIYGREIINNGGELGFHGYNHQSLAMKGYIKQDLKYNPWESKKNMGLAMMELYKYSKSVFPYYDFRVYVPPSNILSPEGRDALLDAVPSIKILSGVYYNDSIENMYVQEFEKSEDGIMEIPRITAGYTKSEENKWNMFNAISSIGVFSHFLHPDDILDVERNQNKSWSELYKEYSDFLEIAKKEFSWLSPMTASDAGVTISNYLSSEVKFKKFDKSMIGYIDGDDHDMNFIIRTDKVVTEKSNCKVSKIDDNIYLIKALDNLFEINISR